MGCDLLKQLSREPELEVELEGRAWTVSAAGLGSMVFGPPGERRALRDDPRVAPLGVLCLIVAAMWRE